MAASIRFPCIANNLSKYRAVFSWCRINTSFYPFGAFANMASNNSYNQVYREGAEKLVRHFSANRSKCPPRKSQQVKEKYGVSLECEQVQFTVVSSGFYTSGKSVILHVGHTAYLFNSGDDAARCLFENGGRWSKLEHLFITHKSYQNVAGTLEMNALLAATGHQKIKLKLHGPEGVDCLVSVGGDIRAFSTDVLRVIERQPPEQLYIDQSVTVQSILFFPTHKFHDQEAAACAYKLAFKALKRKVNTDSLVKLCVKPGPWLKKIVEENETVEVNGKTISPDDVLFKAGHNDVVLVIECPTTQHLQDMMSKTDKLARRADNGEFVDVIIHLTPDEVVSHEKYQEWMSQFPQSTTHLVISESRSCVSLKYSWDQQVALNKLDENIFPLPYPRPTEESDEQMDGDKDIPSNMLQVQSGSSYTLRPLSSRGLSNMQTHKSTESSVWESFNNIGQVKQALEDRVSLTDENQVREYPVVTMLGTGASTSSRNRNVSGILVETEKDKYILLDCGYAVIGQLRRLYGHEKADEILRNLKAVFVSHGHADHHGGILAFMCARREAFKDKIVPKLYFIFPRKLGVWYFHLDRNFPGYMTSVRSLFCGYLKEGSERPKNFENIAKQFTFPAALAPPERAALHKTLGLTSLTTFTVQHAYALSCYGIRLEHKNWKMVYTGDTMPCKEVVDAAKDVDLLIHEATFGQQFEKDAELKTHSTVHQAMDIAKEAGAKFTLLTHFSARYPRLPECTERLMNATDVGVACDNMVLRPKDLRNTTLQSLYSVFEAMYPDHVSNPAVQYAGIDPKDVVRLMNKKTEQEHKHKQNRKRKHSSPQPETSTSTARLDNQQTASTSSKT